MAFHFVRIIINIDASLYKATLQADCSPLLHRKVFTVPLTQKILYELARKLEERELVWEDRGNNTNTVFSEGRAWNLYYRPFEKQFLLSTNGQRARNYTREDLPTKWRIPENEEKSLIKDDHWKD